MSTFIYSKMSGKNDPMYGKFEHAIKALIEHESDVCEKQKNILDVLYNVEKSNRASETVMAQSEFETFHAKVEGAKADNDSIEKTYHKTIEHIAFGKEFTITREMADDAQFGIGANIKALPRAFTRAYYKTRTKVGAQALIHGTASEMRINSERVDLTCGDKKPLFCSEHPYSLEKFAGETQSNFFYGDITASESKLEKGLVVLSNKLRNFKDESGETMEYVADTVILPCNRPEFELKMKKVIGSERVAGTDYNDINIQYGAYTLVVLPGWETTDDRFMMMSSAANRNLLGNMFYNRVKLDIRNHIDDATRNFVWNGYCRFGVGFNSWKHILLAVNSSSAVTGATSI